MSLQSFNFIEEDLMDLFSKVKPDELQLLKNSTVCITGGSGFVGTWLCEIIYFLNENHNYNTTVLVLDRDIEKAKNNSPHLFNSKWFQYQRVDVRYVLDLPKDVTHIVHAAGLPDSRNQISNPVDVMSSIAIGTESVLRAAERLSNLKMFLNLSSSLVYGNFVNRTENVKETDFFVANESSVSSSYIDAKRYSESLTAAYRHQYRMPITTLRPFTLAGPYQPLSGPWAINNFISDAIHGVSLKVLGDGETLRSFIYASDMAFWILKTLIYSETGSRFNLGSPETISIKDLAHLVLDHFGLKKDILYHAGTGAALKKSRMVPDTSLIQNTFNLKLTVPLKKTIERTIQWHLLGKNNSRETTL